jgi:hypothetical protein
MPYRYWAWFTLTDMPKVDTDECARLVQMYIPQLSHTTTWKPGEGVIDILERGGKIESGTAVATFVKGRYPTCDHRHARQCHGDHLAGPVEPVEPERSATADDQTALRISARQDARRWQLFPHFR